MKMIRPILAIIIVTVFGCSTDQIGGHTKKKWQANFSGDRHLTLLTEFEAEKKIMDSTTSEILTLGYRHDTTFVATCFWTRGHNRLEGGADIKNDTLILYYWVSDSLSCDSNKTQVGLTYYLKSKINTDSIQLGGLEYIDARPPQRQKCDN
jgi:hypothetical protein